MANNFLSPYAAAYGGRSPQLSPRGLSPEPGQAYGAWYDPHHGHQFYQHPAAAMDPYMACRSISPNRLSPDPGRIHPQLSPTFQGAHHAQYVPHNMDFYGAFPLNNNYAWNINNNTIVYTDDEEINTNTPGLFYSANALPPPHQVVPPAHDTPRSVASPLPRIPAVQVQQHNLMMQQRANNQRPMQHLTLPNQQFKVKQPVEKKTPEQPKQPEKQPDVITKQTAPPTGDVPPVSPSAVSAGSGGSGGSGRSSRLLSISESQGQMSRSQTSSSIRKKSKPGKINLTRYRGNERLPFAAVGSRRKWQMEVTTGAIFLLVGAICVLVDLADDYSVGSMYIGCGLAAFGVVFIITGFVWREQISRKKAKKAAYPGSTPYSELLNQAVTPTTPSKEFSDGLITP